MDGYVTIGTELDSSMVDKQIDLLQDKLEGLVEEYDILEKVEPFDRQNEELIKLGREIETTRKRLAKLVSTKEAMGKTDFSGIKNSIDSAGNSITKIIKKIGRWGLAIFGIRSAYMGIRSAINTIAGDDEQLKADIDYMKNAVAYALEPLVRSIVNFAKQLLFYVQYIIKAWTGKNIFENANKSLQNANKQAKQLKKTMAGFDEMNILNSDGSVSSTAPSFNLASPEDVPIPGWIQWIADNGEIVGAVIAGITGALISMKILGLDPIMALGIGAIIAGIILLIKDVIDMIKDPSWQGFANILGDITIIIGGIMLVMNNWWGLLVIIVGAIVKLVANNWDAIMNVLKTVGGWIYDNIIKPVGDFFSGLWNGIVNGVKTAFNFIKSVFNSIVSFFSGIVNSILKLFKNIGTNVGNVIGSAFKAVVNAVLGAIESILNFPIRAINGLISVINAIPGINIGKLSTFKLPRLAKGGIVNNPGPGVMMGSYIAGEKGPEAVIPLDDATLDRLGLAFARHTAINTTIPVYVGNRLVAREMKRIDAEDNFAFNG